MLITAKNNIIDIKVRYGEKLIDIIVENGLSVVNDGKYTMYKYVTESLKEHIEPKNLKMVSNIVSERIIELNNKYN